MHREVDCRHWDGQPFEGLDVRHWLDEPKSEDVVDPTALEVSVPAPSMRSTTFEVVDDFGRMAESGCVAPVVCDFGVQVTHNPVWFEQRLDPFLVFTLPSGQNP